MEWKRHFLNVARGNGWDDDAMVQWLRVILVGRAQRNISRVSEDFSFQDVIKPLDEEFEPSSQQAWFQAELKTRVKRSTEGWAEYADDLRELAERGFPDMPNCAREQLALHVYFRQLNHLQVSFSVKQKWPATLDEAVAATIEMEPTCHQRQWPQWRNSNTLSKADLDAITLVTASSLKRGDNTVQQILGEIIQRLEALETPKKPAMSSTSNVICYRCGRKWHRSKLSSGPTGKRTNTRPRGRANPELSRNAETATTSWGRGKPFHDCYSS